MNKNESVSYQAYLFHEGTNFNAYKFMGAHEIYNENKSVFECTFRTWAPNAEKVAVACDYTGWDTPKQMQKITSDGIWEAVVTNNKSFDGMYYKFEVTGADGKAYLKSDPYAFYSETLSKTASIVKNIASFEWNDEKWLKYRGSIINSKKTNGNSDKYHFYPAPMNIYEVHLASWKTLDGKSTSDGEHYKNYREIAKELVVYVKEMGYTHIELLPIMEYPYDGSWGYQICGYYAPTSRFGSPEDFAFFVNLMHLNGIGVILDWVPAHFPKDRHGLFEFDGQPLYEYQGKDRMEHKGWGTRCFDVGRSEVQSFLISNALFWMKEYHIDGLRIDAVASMLYLDYDRAQGEWVPNKYGNNHNLESISFFRKLNSAVFAEFPDVLMIAEESTAWPSVTKPAHEGGLGFNFKWNMGWANDMFEYVSCDPLFRKYHHTKLTFPLVYAFSENYVLPISHDEVVHGKKSLIDKMFGEYDEKFSCMRAFLTYMMTIPGKKLMFMGCEYAQFREWDYENELEWFMLDYPRHSEMRNFVKDLNNLYLKTPELWEIDDSWDGFEWIDADNANMNIISYVRRGINGGYVIAVINFSPVLIPDFKLKVFESGIYEEYITTDLYKYGGKNTINGDEIISKKYDSEDSSSKDDFIKINLPPLSGIILRNKKPLIKPIDNKNKSL